VNQFTHEKRVVRLSTVQHDCVESIDRNIEHALALIKEAVRLDAEVVCLQELFANTYFAGQNIKKNEAIDKYAETIKGPIVTLLKKTARQARIVIIGGSFYERGTGNSSGQYFNSSPIIDSDGQLLAVHRKAHIPNDPGYFERNYFDMGNKLATVTETQKGKIGVGICFDQWFPAVAQSAADQGAEALFYPTAIGHTNDELSGYIPGDSGLWNRKLNHVLAGQAANNHLYVGIANRVGVEGDTRFFGQSAIYDHVGDTRKMLGTRRDGVATADCDLGLVPIIREAWGFHHARRNDLQS
jgi:N-carbamoylputrescine amidase